MVNSISNDKMPTAAPATGRNDSGKAEGEVGKAPPREAAQQRNGQVTISTTGRLLSQESRPATHIQTAEQARSLAARIKQQFSDMGSQALRTHSGTGALEPLLKGVTA